MKKVRAAGAAALVATTGAASLASGLLFIALDVGGLGALVLAEASILTPLIFLAGAQLVTLPAFGLALLWRHCRAADPATGPGNDGNLSRDVGMTGARTKGRVRAIPN